VRKVLLNDGDNIMAKTFLREQLGACHKLLRTVLRRIISGEIFATEEASSSSSHGIIHSRLDEIEMQVGAFLGRFNCLVPAASRIPLDDGTLSLVRQARLVLMEPIVQAMCPTTKGGHHPNNHHWHLPKNGNTFRQVLRLQEVLSAIDQWSRQRPRSRIDQKQSSSAQEEAHIWKRFQEALLTEKASSLAAMKR
jgi:hypothetical protein